MSIKKFLTLLIFISSAVFAQENGKSLYESKKFGCVNCHGTGGEGGRGPSFKGIGKKYSKDQLMKRASHNCPPTGACSPKELGAIVEYIRKF